MPRHASRKTPIVVSGILYTDDAFTGTAVGSPAWFAWLDTASTFYFEGKIGTFTAHLERRQRGGLYWVAYRRRAGILHRSHLGKAHLLTLDCLQTTAADLAQPVQKVRSTPSP
jgi:LuxR family transcriptional regulator, maltose regulon positive regulatory protein